LSIELTLRSCQRDIQQALFDPGNTIINRWKGAALAVSLMATNSTALAAEVIVNP
jgi:hypothetical protein